MIKKNQKIMQLLNEWMKMQLMNETRYDVFKLYKKEKLSF